jgi:hypothetical protein
MHIYREDHREGARKPPPKAEGKEPKGKILVVN